MEGAEHRGAGQVGSAHVSEAGAHVSKALVKLCAHVSEWVESRHGRRLDR